MKDGNRKAEQSAVRQKAAAGFGELLGIAGWDFKWDTCENSGSQNPQRRQGNSV